MKLYRKHKLVAIRINDFMDARINRVAEHLQLDRSDLIRMFINNALRYWEKELIKSNLKDQSDNAYANGYTNQDLEYLANKEIKIQLAQKELFPKASEQKTSRKLKG
jgi:antitoxin component of RelBE/YafQ-DinJ toxin-antitoxin module